MPSSAIHRRQRDLFDYYGGHSIGERVGNDRLHTISEPQFNSARNNRSFCQSKGFKDKLVKGANWPPPEGEAQLCIYDFKIMI